MNVAVTFEDTVSLGTLVVMFLIGTAGALGVIYGGRYRVAYEAASAAANELRQALKDAHDRLADAMHELADAKRVIERYEALPNMERIVTLMSETATRAEARADERVEFGVARIVKTIDQHEERAAERQGRIVVALDEVTTRLEHLNEGSNP